MVACQLRNQDDTALTRYPNDYLDWRHKIFASHISKGRAAREK